MKIALLLSAGGSVFEASAPYLASQHELIVLTDRECGAETRASEHGVPSKRTHSTTREDVSKELYEYANEFGADCALMMFDRIVTKPLVGGIPLLNIHPALLPAFRGTRAPERAIAENARYIGATLHTAVEEVDAGPILAQTCQPIPLNADEGWANKAAFIHKVALSILTGDLLATDSMTIEGTDFRVGKTLETSLNISPFFITSDAEKAFREFQNSQPFNLLP